MILGRPPWPTARYNQKRPDSVGAFFFCGTTADRLSDQWPDAAQSNVHARSSCSEASNGAPCNAPFPTGKSHNLRIDVT